MQNFSFAKIYSSMWDICFKTTIAVLKCNVHTYNGFWNYVFPVHDDITNLKHAYVTRLYNVHILHLLILDQSSSDTDLLETKAFIMVTRLALKNTIYQGIESNTVKSRAVHVLVSCIFSEGLWRRNLMLMYCDLWPISSKIE